MKVIGYHSKSVALLELITRTLPCLGHKYTFANLPAECSPVNSKYYKIGTIMSNNQEVYEQEDIGIDDQIEKPKEHILLDLLNINESSSFL